MKGITYKWRAVSRISCSPPRDVFRSRNPCATTLFAPWAAFHTATLFAPWLLTGESHSLFLFVALIELEL